MSVCVILIRLSPWFTWGFNDMYGLVNRALQQLVCARCGDEGWRRVRSRAGVDDEVFVRMDSYPDAMTERLLAHASEELNTTAGQLLEDFGRYWVRYTMAEGYGALLSDLGNDFHAALDSLDGMHARVSLLYPALKPPRFRCETLGDDRIRVHYWSDRRGLAPMVVGLIDGLAERYGLQTSTTHEMQHEPGHDSFVIQLQGKLADAN